MSIHAEADLILRLYELRREATMRKARDWFFLEFNPESVADFNKAMFSEYSGHLRMVMTYWDMAAALVNRGAISLDLFSDTNGEHLSTFAKIEPLLPEIRAAVGPQFMASLEKLVDTMPNGRERTAKIRERMKDVRAKVVAARQEAVGAGVGQN